MTETKDARIYLRMPQALADEIEKAAAKEYLTRSEYVRKVLADSVRREQ